MAMNQRQKVATASAYSHAVVWWATFGKFKAQYGAVCLSDCVDGRSTNALLELPVHEPVRFKYGKATSRDGYECNIVVFCKNSLSAVALVDILKAQIKTLEFHIGADLRKCEEAPFTPEVAHGPPNFKLGSPNWIRHKYGVAQGDEIIAVLRRLRISELEWPMIFYACEAKHGDVPKAVMASRFKEQEIANFCTGKPGMTVPKGDDGKPLRDASGNLLPPKQQLLPDKDLMIKLILAISNRLSSETITTRFRSIIQMAKKSTRAASNAAASTSMLNSIDA